MTEGSRFIRRAVCLLVLFLMVMGAGNAGAVSYLKPTPQGTVGVSRPTIAQQIYLEPGESILRATMWLDGARVEPTWDETGLVSYLPAVALTPGAHTVRLSVEVSPGVNDYRYDPIASNFSFTVANGAIELLPQAGPEEMRALAQVNRYRVMAGLEPMTYQAALGAAAAGHARYLVANPRQQEVNAHGETQGWPLYFGATGGQRARYYGYAGGNAEVINFADRAEDAIDGWMDTLYHRIPLLAPGNLELGYGLAAAASQTVNVLMAGPNEFAEGTVLWPVPGQTNVPTGWDGLEVPDPFRLYPDAGKPVGYTITMSFGGQVKSLTLDSWSLTGPAGRVQAMSFSPVNDDRLEDTVSLIPYSPFEPGTTYTVTMNGRVDLGRGAQTYSRTWSFTTAAEHAPQVQRMSTRTRSGVLTSVTVDGTGFGQGLRVFLGGLPVEGLRIESSERLSFTPPTGLSTGSQDLLVTSAGGREVLWRQFLSDPSVRYPEGTPFSSVPVLVHGKAVGAQALSHPSGAVLLPESVLAELGARGAWIQAINRSYWTWGSTSGDYTLGKATATAGDSSFVMALPAQVRGGQVYIEAEFVSRLTGQQVPVTDGRIQVGMQDIGSHWARTDIVRLLQAGIVGGTGDGRFRPDEPLTRAAFVKMLTAARGVAALPGRTGGFLDTGSHWVAAQGYIGAAVQAGIVGVTEYPGGNFLPDQPITREEMAVMVTRALGREVEARSRTLTLNGGSATVGGKAFTDATAWSRPGYVAVAVELGIINGYQEDGGSYTFRPTRQATRAEATVMVGRTLNK